MLKSPGRILIPDRAARWPLRALDATCVIAAHLVCLTLSDSQEFADAHVLSASALAALLFAVSADINGLYRFGLFTGAGKVELGRVWVAWFFVPPFLLLVAFITKTTDTFSRVVTMSWFAGVPVLLSVVRLGVRLLRRRLLGRGATAREVIIAGATRMGATLAKRIQDDPQLGLRVAGYYDDREPERRHEMPQALGPAAGGMDELVRRAKAGEIDLVYITLPLRAESRISDMVRELADTTASVYVVADFMVFDLLHAEWSSVSGIPVVSIFESPFYGVNGWLKRVEDLVIGTLILLLISGPMIAIALAVKLTSKGPIFFRQRRYGLNGEEIRVLKFRSMTVMEDGDQVTQAQKEDKRITRVGGFLRRTSLDELPQFLNVLSGEMSIVGPRPHAVAHNEMYRRLIHGYMLRHKVKPGITGWAQVNGWRGETDTLEKMEQRVLHDLHYIQNWGLMFDLRIIFQTIFGSSVRQNAH